MRLKRQRASKGVKVRQRATRRVKESKIAVKEIKERQKLGDECIWRRFKNMLIGGGDKKKLRNLF